jgi:hypothetical protein
MVNWNYTGRFFTKTDQVNFNLFPLPEGANLLIAKAKLHGKFQPVAVSQCYIWAVKSDLLGTSKQYFQMNKLTSKHKSEKIFLVDQMILTFMVEDKLSYSQQMNFFHML